MSSTLRHSSPAVQGSAALSANKESSTRLSALGMADAFAEVLQVIPSTYRETLRPHLRRLADIASKCDGVRATHTKLRRHKAESSLPPQLLGVHKPKFDITREFSETNPELVAGMDAAYATYRAQALDSAIALKAAEVTHLEELLRPQTYLETLFNALSHGYASIKDRHQQPVFTTQHDGELVITGWTPSKVLENEFKRLCDDIAPIASRLILIERSKTQAEEAKKSAKKSLKDAADVEMGDATTSTASIQDIVQKELAAALKKANLGNVSILLSDRIFNHPLTTRMLSDAKGSGRQEEGWALETAEGPKGYHHFERQGEGSAEAIRQEASPRPQRQREAEAIVSASNFRYENWKSYPDALLSLPTPLAIRYVIRAALPDVVEAARYRAEIHLGPGVFLPRRLSIHLSTGLKFMFARRSSPELIREAYSDFCDRLRWRCYWTMKETTGDLRPKPYDPDYEVIRERSVCDYNEPYIEAGLAEGSSYVEKFIRDVVPTLKTSSRLSKLVEVTELQEYLEENKFIVSPTDKNLGCSVITRQWFIDGCNSLLSDTSNYQLISSAERQVKLETQCEKAVELAKFAHEMLDHRQLSRFLRSMVPDDVTEEPKVPVFYGIPKIHKTPVKMRPIVPCHSAVQNPAAKYVSKQLKPLLAERPYLILGSKDLAIKLAKLNYIPGRKVYLVSGDIVAFYPNVPLEECVDITKTWFLEWIGQKQTLAEKHMFSACLRLATRDLIFDFMERSYLQKQGLAMGIACSPDLANLYGCFYEEKVLPIEDLIFFGRFIDDALAIVYANTSEEALLKVSAIKYGAVQIEWSVSELQMPFLDLLLYIDPGTGRVEHKPYRKARNHLERIPWASAHPKDVKKGTFVGEMSRLAVLSSTRAGYLDAIDHLKMIYIARGYPPDLIKSWLKDNASKRWRNRFDRSESEGDVFVLKSHFNPVWNAFNIHELGHIVTSRWLSFLEAQDDRNRQFLGVSSPHLEPPALTGQALVGHGPGRRRGLGPKSPLPPAVPRGENSGLNLGSGAAAPLIVIPKPLGYQGRHIELRSALDVRKLGYHERSWLVSRKRNFNLFDLVAKLKQNVLYVLSDPDVIMDNSVDTWD